jgi:hypothetical protein
VTLVVTFIGAACASAIVPAGNKSAHVILKFTVVAHEVLATVASVALHMINADTTVLAWSRRTFVDVYAARVTCNM